MDKCASNSINHTSNITMNTTADIATSHRMLLHFKDSTVEPAFDFDGRPYVELLRSNLNVILCVCVTYVAMVFWSKNQLKDTKPWSSQLTVCAIAWNVLLAVFSAICFVLFSVESVTVWSSGGWHGVVCSVPPHNGHHALWSLMFIASKLWEFGDTALLVLRGRPVTFLHWYHHCTVLMLSCYIGGHNSPLRRIFANVNSGVHGLMYSYYALAVGGFKLSRKLSMAITTLQVIQMVLGVAACVHYLGHHGSSSCPQGAFTSHDLSPVYFSLFVYFTYLILFLQFFHQAYIKRGKRQSPTPLKQVSSATLGDPNCNTVKTKTC